jgi:hypothetical protein
MEITTTDIQLFQILKQKLGEKEAEALVSFVESKLKENNQTNLKVLSTKEDIAKNHFPASQLSGSKSVVPFQISR